MSKTKKSELAKRRTRVDTNRQGQEGVAWVQWIVEGLWQCGMEIISAHNDDAVDAAILLKRRSGLTAHAGPTGDLIFVQIKTGYNKENPKADYDLTLGKKHIQLHRARWASYPGPAVMINVIPRRLTSGDPVAYWTVPQIQCRLRHKKNQLLHCKETGSRCKVGFLQSVLALG